MENFSIIPLNDKVVVKPFAPEEKTSFGIIIPDSHKVRPNKGTVMAVAKESALKSGDVVLFGKTAGVEVEEKGEAYLLLREQDLFAVIKEEGK